MTRLSDNYLTSRIRLLPGLVAFTGQERYQEYAVREEQRRLTLQLPEDYPAPSPKLEVVAIDL